MQSAYGHPSQAVQAGRLNGMGAEAPDYPPSPSRRSQYSRADHQSPSRHDEYAYNREETGYRSYGAAFESMPDRAVATSARPRTAPFADRSPRRYPGHNRDSMYDRTLSHANPPAITSPSRHQGATALLQQHAANQWAFRANQTNLPAVPSAPSVLQQPPTRTTYPPASHIAHAGNDVPPQGSHEFAARAPRTVTYTPYSYGSGAPGSRPPLPHREQSSSGSSTSASTTPGTSQASLSGRSNGNGFIDGTNGTYHARSTSSSGQSSSNADFSRMFFDPLRIKQRRRTSPAQLRVLEHHFERTPKPDLALRKRLASELEMTPREVQVWFQNRRAKVKKLAERAERANGGPSSSMTRNDVADNESDEQMAGGDDEGDDDDDSASRSRMRTASAPSSSRRGPTVSRYSSNDFSAQYDSESAELPDPRAYVGPPRADLYGSQTQQPSLSADELRLPLPPNPNDYYEPVGPSASGRRYSLPAFASSVIPPTPYDENGSGVPIHTSPVQDPYSPSLFVPSSAPAAGAFRQRPTSRSTGNAYGQPNEHSPAHSASSRASEAIPMAIPEHAEVSSWDGSAAAPTHPSTEYMASRRSSAPSQVFPMYEEENGSAQLAMDPSEGPFVVTSGPNGSEPGTSYTHVYPPPVSMIDPVASVAFLRNSEQAGPKSYSYPYVRPSATMQDASASMTEAPLYVTAEELGGSAVR